MLEQRGQGEAMGMSWTLIIHSGTRSYLSTKLHAPLLGATLVAWEPGLLSPGLLLTALII